MIKIFVEDQYPFVKKFECGCRYLQKSETEREKIPRDKFKYLVEKEYNVSCKECLNKW